MPYSDNAKNLEWSAFKKRQLRVDTRTQIIQLLGGVCKKCGFSDSRALHIDHVNGGGSVERKELGSRVYTEILERIKCGSDDYQLLCANCNSIKRIENKEDTHRKYVATFQPVMKKPLLGCGTPASYRRGCRCDNCVTAWNTYMREYMRDKKTGRPVR